MLDGAKLADRVGIAAGCTYGLYAGQFGGDAPADAFVEIARFGIAGDDRVELGEGALACGRRDRCVAEQNDCGERQNGKQFRRDR